MRFHVLIWITIAFTAGLFAKDLPINTTDWTILGDESGIEQHLGRTAIALKGGQAIYKGIDFENGVIEFDVAFPSDRNFIGVFWRSVDAGNYEDFYMRPHQSGKGDANQYTPVFNGNSGWQLYHGEGYGAPTEYLFDRWMPVKIVVAGDRAKIYIRDMTTPAFITHQFKRDLVSGKVGLKNGRFAKAWFSNIRISTDMPAPITGELPEIAAAPQHTLMSYEVSTGFPEKQLEKKYRLEKSDKQGLKWMKLDTEANGIANLSRLQTHRGDNNTAFVKVTIESYKEQLKELKFGYSDRVKVYVNDRLLYSGNNGYRTRDFRYLGTIGLFDSVYLPLKRGSNEIWFAVSENFGGWGILAQLENTNGIRVLNRLQLASNE